MKQNYQLMLDNKLKELCAEGKRPSLLLHACCAPCSSYVLEYLSKYFDITLFFYNPNISPASEHDVRLCELERLVRDMGLDVDIVRANYEPQKFLEIAKGLENLPEASERCRRCYELRLDKTARAAAEGGFDYFTTTLTISPLKNAALLNELGAEMGEKYGVAWLYSDFKKRGGYKRSIELSREFDLYRQNYCGCVFSKREREAQACVSGDQAHNI
jgi:predicted adenine nucleotide alpha hydrolase (AANH) superfamily ATPase